MFLAVHGLDHNPSANHPDPTEVQRLVATDREPQQAQWGRFTRLSVCVSWWVQVLTCEFLVECEDAVVIDEDRAQEEQVVVVLGMLLLHP